MGWLRSMLFNLAFYGWTAFLAILAIPSLVLPRRVVVRFMETWSAGIQAMMRPLVGIKVAIGGREHLPQGACIVASKHQSAFDTLVFHTALNDPAMVMKQELTWIPLYGWCSLHAGMIAVDRKGGAGALKRLLKDARRAKGEGRPIVIFPEGTRTPPGEKRTYQPGVAALYRDLDLPVVPVAVDTGLYWPRRSFRRSPGTMRIEFLEPIQPGLDRKAFTAELERRIEARCKRLLETVDNASSRIPRD
jgi:1-acyl-sn-glycerol-3-phosphate acyltransferase